jgi:hypothetical protein
MSDAFPHLDYKPTMPRRLDHTIGIIGAGGIVNYAHLPAYKKAGFKVLAVTDKNLEQAQRTAAQHNIPKVYASVDELLSNPEIQIVDIAVYPEVQGVLVEQAAKAGKHLLCQKPFSDEYAKAVRSVELAGHSVCPAVDRPGLAGHTHLWQHPGPLQNRLESLALDLPGHSGGDHVSQHSLHRFTSLFAW